MSGIFDIVLGDEETVSEMRLVTELMVVASLVPGDLDAEVVDGALGLDRSPRDLPTWRRQD